MPVIVPLGGTKEIVGLRDLEEWAAREGLAVPDLVWRWRTEEGLTTREIAARLGVSVGTLLRRIPQVERRRYWEWKWGLPFEEGMERLLRERSQAEVARMTGFSESFVSAFVRRSRRAAVGRLA